MASRAGMWTMFSTSLIRKTTLIIFLVASCNFVWQEYSKSRQRVEAQRHWGEYGITACTFGPSRDSVARLHIEFFLLLVLIGSRLKGLKRSVFSVVGLTGAVISYILWWQYIFFIMRNAEASVDAINNFAYLAGGNVVDVAIAGAVTWLFTINVVNAALTSFRLEMND